MASIWWTSRLGFAGVPGAAEPPELGQTPAAGATATDHAKIQTTRVR
jgi:hypothetical protein